MAPRFDYGRQEHELHLTEHGAVFVTPALTLTLHTSAQGDERLVADGPDARTVLDLVAGDRRALILESSADGPPRAFSDAQLDDLEGATKQFWQDLARRRRPTPVAGARRSSVRRSR